MRARYYTDKILDRLEASEQAKQWKKDGKKVVFTNGCFDILHPGHMDILSKAAAFGDRLIVGLNSDDSVKRLNKGEERPINGQRSRAIMLASLSFVDAVVIFDEDTPYELIKEIKPDVLAKGGDYEEDEIVGSDLVTDDGGEVQVIPLLEGYSTTEIIDRIRKNEDPSDS